MSDRDFTFFGTDLQKIPCFKKSFSYGIYTGLAAGLGHFLFTSKVKRSTDIALYSFVGSTMCFWVYCRYQWANKRSLTQKINESYHTVMLTDGAKKKFDDV